MTDTETDATDHTDLITALQQGPGSRELSDQVLTALGWHHDSIGWLSPKNVKSYHNGFLPMVNLFDADPTQSIDDACACGGVSDMSDSQRRFVLKTAIDMFCDALDDGATAEDGARFFCIAIFKAKEAEND